MFSIFKLKILILRENHGKQKFIDLFLCCPTMAIPLKGRRICVNSALFYDHPFREGLFILMNGLIFTERITDINRRGLSFSGEKREQKRDEKKEKKEKNHPPKPS